MLTPTAIKIHCGVVKGDYLEVLALDHESDANMDIGVKITEGEIAVSVWVTREQAQELIVALQHVVTASAEATLTKLVTKGK